MTIIARRKLLRFALILTALLGVLGWPFSWAGRSYCSLVCRAVNGLVLNSTDTQRLAQLVPDQRPGFEWEAIATIRNQPIGSAASQFNVDIHHLFYLPTVVFVALTLAGKITWGGKRVVAKLFVGILLFHLRGMLPFVSLERIATGIAHDGFVEKLLVLVNESLLAPLAMTFALPLLLWLGLFQATLVRPRKASVSKPGPG
jgi:hypothetical protein